MKRVVGKTTERRGGRPRRAEELAIRAARRGCADVSFKQETKDGEDKAVDLCDKRIMNGMTSDWKIKRPKRPNDGLFQVVHCGLHCHLEMSR